MHLQLDRQLDSNRRDGFLRNQLKLPGENGLCRRQASMQMALVELNKMQIPPDRFNIPFATIVKLKERIFQQVIKDNGPDVAIGALLKS